MLTIRPQRRSIIDGSSAWVRRRPPLKLTSRTSCQNSSSATAGAGGHGPAPYRRASCESLVAQLLERGCGFIELLQSHAPEHHGRFGELDVTVVDDLELITGRVADTQRAAGGHVLAALFEGLAQRFLVVDHEADMTASILVIRAVALA